MISYNGNLITCYSGIKEFKDNKKETVSQIIQKNYEIATKTFSRTSIHLLYHLSMCLINKIAAGKIKSAKDANDLIKQMREIITKFHNGDVRNLNNQLFFQIQLLYAQIIEQEMGG